MKKTKLIVALVALICLLVSALAVHTFAADGTGEYGGLALGGGTDEVTGNKFGMDSYQTCKDMETIPVTLEAWVYVPSSLKGETLGTLYGNYWTSSKYGMAYINWEIVKNAVPRLVWNSSLDGELYDVTFSETSLPTDSWAHLAIVYNGSTGVVSCYVNGSLTEEKYYYPAIDPDVLELPMFIGSDSRTMNTNYFKGEIGDITVYSDVRTAEELKGDYDNGMNEKPDLTDAICYYDIDSSDIGKNITDETKNGYDIIYSKAWLTETEMEAIRSASGFTPSYSFAVMGDTQMLADYYPEKMPTLYQWIVDNAAPEKKNIKFAIGLGDITNDNGIEDRYEYDEVNKVYYKVSSTADSTAPYTQWDVAYDAITLLDGKIHYSLIRGNHDVYGDSNGNKPEGFNACFENSEWFTSQFTSENGGGLYTTGTDPVTGYKVSYANTYQTLSVNNTQYLFLNLDWKITEDIVNWAENVIKTHPNHSVIVSTHSYLNGDGTTEDLGDPTPRGSYNGDVLWDILFSKYANVKMILSGHIDNESIVTTQVRGDHGNTVTQVLINPQGFDSKLGGTAMIAMFYFNEAGDEIFIEWYSPTKDRYYRNYNQFVIDLDATAEKNAATAWDGVTVTEPEGAGTESEPYLVANAANLAWISSKITEGGVSFAGKYFEQTADIDLAGNVLTSIGNYYVSSANMAAFGGIYDGCGKTIKNGTITGGKLKTSTSSPAPERYFNYSEGYGLFGAIYGATIKNIVLDNVQVVGKGVTGAIVGRAAAPELTNTDLGGFNTIVGCNITESVKIVSLLPQNVGSTPTSFDDGRRAGRVGSVCGMAYSTNVVGCTSAAEFSLSGDFTLAGGIVGAAGLNSRIEKCAFTGGMTLAECASGLVSYLGGIVGAVSPSATSTNVLGNNLNISGTLYIGNCYNSGYFTYLGDEITSDIYYGGIIGFFGDLSDVADDTVTYPYLIENCYNLYEKTKEHSALNIAGIVGYSTAGAKTLYVKNSYSVAVDVGEGENNEYKFAEGLTSIDGLNAIVPDPENCGTLAKADMSAYVSAVDNEIASVKENGIPIAWKIGSGVPTSAAADGVKYLDLASNIYYLYENSTWNAVANITITDNSLDTEKYGTILNEYATNTIIVFQKSGDSYICIGGFDTLFDAVNFAINSKYKLTYDPAAECVIYLRADTSANTYVSGNLGYIVGKLIFDLGGHTLTQASDEPIFRGYSKYLNGTNVSYPDTYYLPANYVITNGNIVLDSYGLFLIGTEGAAYNNVTAPDPYKTKTLNWTLDGVNVSLAKGATLSSLVGIYEEKKDNTADKDTCLNLTIKDNCVLDITYAPANFVLFDAYDPITDGKISGSTAYNTNSIVNVTVGACDIIAANDEFTLHKINYDNGSSVTYTEDENGNCLTLNIGGTDYKHEDLYTPYGYIDIDYIDVSSNPIIEFDYSNGKYTCYKAYDSLTTALSDSGVRQRCRDEGTLAVLYFRDNVVVEEKMSGNMGYITGTLVFDLGGNTITQKSDAPLLKAYAKYDGTRIGHSNFKLINGKVVLNNHSLFHVGAEGVPYTNDITHVKNVNWTLDNLEIIVGANVKNVFTEYGDYGSSNNDGRKMVFNLTVGDNCIIDLSNAAAGTVLFGANDPNIKNTAGTTTKYVNSKVNITVGSCSILATSGKDPVWLSVNEENGSSVTFTKGAGNSGATVTVGDVTCTYESLTTPYGYVPVKYAAYPIAEFKVVDGENVFNKGYAYFNEIFGVNTLCRDADAKAMICLREDIRTSVYTGTNSYVSGNLCWNMGTVIIDLNGHTIIQDAPNTILRAYAKHDGNDVSDTGKFELTNGNIVLNSHGIFEVGAEGSGYSGTNTKKTLYWTLDRLNISFGENATVTSLIQFEEKLKVAREMGMNVTIKDTCVIDLENAPANFLLFNANETTSAYTDSQVIFNVEGVKIIGGNNSFKWLDVHASNGSAVNFDKSDDGNYMCLVLPKNGAASIDTSTVFKTSDGIELALVKISEDDDTVTYRLRPKAVSDVSFVPKLSLTLDRNLVMNAYIPANGLQKFTFDDKTYDNLEAIADKKVTLEDGKEYYLIEVSLNAGEAARDLKLIATVDVDGKSATGTFTFSIPKYAEKILADGSEVEKALVKDVLQYIRAAYAYFGTSDAEQMAKIDAILGEYASKPTVEGSAADETTGLKSATFVLDGTPSMRFYLADGADASKYSFFIDGKQVATEVAEDGSYVDIDVYAYALCETVTYTVDGESGGSFHINAYYAYVSGNGYTEDDKAELVTLTESFWRYLQSARVYRNSVVEN